MLELIQLFYGYDSWASDQLLTSLAPLNREEYNAPGCSGHGSIRATLAHLLSTQYSWFSWYDGSMTVEEAIPFKLAEEETETLDAARERWAINDKKMHQFVDSQTEQSLREDRAFTLANGYSSSLQLGRMLLHTANHGTHTRAQIIAGIRRAGHDPGNFEMLNFLLTNSQVR